jgi:predicted permease
VPTALRSAFRVIAKTPVLSGVVIAMVAIAIGANTAIFSVLQAVILRPLPLQEPDRLVRLFETLGDGRGEGTRFSLSPVAWARWREANTVFTDIARVNFGTRTLTREGALPQRLIATQVSANFLSVLGVRPALGRDLDDADDRPGAAPVVLVGDAFWRSTLGGRSDVIGQILQLDGRAHTIIGVLPAGFRHPYRTDIWVPFAEAVDFTRVGTRGYYAPARLRPGVTIPQAEAAMRELCRRINAEHPLIGAATGAVVLPLHSTFVADLQPKLIAITIAAAFVLLIAGANLTSLFLARHIEGRRDTAVRLALGATRARLVRESLAQSLVLVTVGALLGLLLAVWLLHPLVALSPLGQDNSGGAIREFDVPITLNAVVLANTAGAALLLALGFGFLPACRQGQVESGTVLKAAGRSGMLDPVSRRWLRGLVTVEVAVAVVLLVAAGLHIRSFQHLLSEPWGYETRNRLALDISFTDRVRPAHAERVDYIRRAEEALRTLPGVRSAYATTPHQMFPAYSLAAITPEGTHPPEPQGFFLTYHRMVFPGYFRAAGISLLRGRAIDATDGADTPLVAVVSETFARRMWPGQDPLGKTIKHGRADDKRRPYVVVGAADRKAIIDRNDGDIVGQWYVAYVQNPAFLSETVTFVLETAVAPETLTAPVRKALAGLDPKIAASNFNTIERLVQDTYVDDRFALILVALFGGLGLLLAILGLYGLLSFQVACRVRELGIRAALGAAPAEIVRFILGEGAVLVGLGLALGLLGVMLLGPFLADELSGVSPADPLVIGFAVLVLGLAALLGMLLPALRAAEVDPIVALRAE